MNSPVRLSKYAIDERAHIENQLRAGGRTAGAYAHAYGRARSLLLGLGIEILTLDPAFTPEAAREAYANEVDEVTRRATAAERWDKALGEGRS